MRTGIKAALLQIHSIVGLALALVLALIARQGSRIGASLSGPHGLQIGFLAPRRHR